MTQPTENKLFKITYANLIALLCLFGGAFAYVETKTANIMRAINANATSYEVLKAGYTDHGRRLDKLEGWYDNCHTFYDKPKPIGGITSEN